MADIIKTWPANVDTRAAAAMFNEVQSTYGAYFFALGRGKPAQDIDHVWFTFRGRILGNFKVDRFVVNDGSEAVFEHLNRACGEGGWTIPHDYWTCICESGFTKLRERLFMPGFRGWRYFDLNSYRSTAAARMRV